MALLALATTEIRPDDALLIVDIQYDFCPGGALAVPQGHEVIGPINGIAHRFPLVVMTQDWHPAGHTSFASSHPDREPFDTITLDYGEQVLWPDHCVQGSSGAAFHEDLDPTPAALILRKGMHAKIDSYSTFYENDGKTTTGLAPYLRARGVKRIFLAGLALDFCVAWSAKDAVKEGFEVVVIDDACRAIDTGGSLAEALKSFDALGVATVRTAGLT